MQGLLAGLLVLSVTYFGGKGLLQRFFFRTGYVYAEETERAEELQEYVTQNKLSASDYKMLKKWGTEQYLHRYSKMAVQYRYSYEYPAQHSCVQLSCNTYVAYKLRNTAK